MMRMKTISTTSPAMASRRQAGFSLIEMLMVILLMSIITGAVFQQIAIVQERYKNESAKIDMFENAREFVDQIVRDIHEAEYPNKRLFQVDKTSTSAYEAVGLVYAGPYEVKFEGDVDDSGYASSVDYQLNQNDLTKCPCTLQRSQVPKDNVTSPEAMPTVFETEIDNVVNTIPVFQYYLVDGTEFTAWNQPASTACTSSSANPCYQTPGYLRVNDDINSVSEPINTIWTVQVNVDLKSPTGDASGSAKPEVYLRARAQVRN